MQIAFCCRRRIDDDDEVDIGGFMVMLLFMKFTDSISIITDSHRDPSVDREGSLHSDDCLVESSNDDELLR